MTWLWAGAAAVVSGFDGDAAGGLDAAETAGAGGRVVSAGRAFGLCAAIGAGLGDAVLDGCDAVLDPCAADSGGVDGPPARYNPATMAQAAMATTYQSRSFLTIAVSIARPPVVLILAQSRVRRHCYRYEVW